MLITLTSNSCEYQIQNPDERVCCYCRLEIYKGYDDQHETNDIISLRNIEVANKLFARISKDTAKEFMKNSEVRTSLSKVENKALGDLSNADWESVRSTVSQLLVNACKITGVGLAVATKVLHLKRPKLIPILDSYIIKLLFDRNMPQNKDRLPLLGIEAMDIIRKDLIANREEFQELGRRLADLPIQLETVRLYDILAWTHEKWERLGLTSAPYGTKSDVSKDS